MKSIALIGMVILNIAVYSQGRFASYKSSYHGRTYEIFAAKAQSGQMGIGIPGHAFDRYDENAGFILHESELPEFIDILNKGRKKYKEWTQIAVANEVTLLEKELPLPEHNVIGYFMSRNGFALDYDVFFKSIFKITTVDKSLKHQWIIRVDGLVDSENSDNVDPGFIIVFQSLEEIDGFIELFSDENLKKYWRIVNQPDLFK